MVGRFPLRHGQLVVAQGSVVNFQGDAIVNAANEGCLGGGGVDGAITRAGGSALKAAREALPVIAGKTVRCKTGSAVITIGGSLAAAHCIHAVGPNYHYLSSEQEGDQLLASAYQTSMSLAAEHGLSSVAFSLISAGVFRGRKSLHDVLDIAVREVAASAFGGLDEVFLVGFTEQEVDVLLDVCSSQELSRSAAAVVDPVVGPLASSSGATVAGGEVGQGTTTPPPVASSSSSSSNGD